MLTASGRAELAKRVRRTATQEESGALRLGMVRDALAHRLQPGEQPSPVLLVIEQAVDLPPVSRVRVLLLAQDVVERVGRGHDHGRDGRPPGQPSSAIPARESQTVVPDADLGGER